MNNDGDFYIGNKRVSSATGQERTFDAPIPTTTGQESSILSAVFDEVVIKERLKVEGGNSGTVLSQFDGPVTFNGETKFNEYVNINDNVKVTGHIEVTNTTESFDKDTGALVINGGVGIEKDVNIGRNINVTGLSTFTNTLDANNGATIDNVRIGIDGDNTIDTSVGILTITSNDGRVDINAATDITGNTVITGILSVTDDITAFYSSDSRLKDNITPIDDPLAKVLSISGNTYDWNEKSNKEGHDVGVIAQEILAVLPEAVTERDNGYLAVDYQKIVPLLVEAIKELSAKVENLEGNH